MNGIIELNVFINFVAADHYFLIGGRCKIRERIMKNKVNEQSDAQMTGFVPP